MSKRKSCVFTGHRPVRFSFGYDDEDEKCIQLKEIMANEIVKLIEQGVFHFYTGMSLGVEQYGAEIILEMKGQYPHIQLIAVLPCETQANRWFPAQREQYFNILASCNDVITLRTHYTPQCMLERNRYLIDHAKYLLAVYDGSDGGNTASTVQYARKKKRDIIVIHPDSLEVFSGVDVEVLERRKQLRILTRRENGNGAINPIL